ncbi:hypothetical protein ACGF0J_22410 [Nonomuraea sp. NPDC047897]|uniref:hypothetical protein n=1 Tax=Nonomuraea sp. NPDC047897 TaxID=3364346 RepID=UPI003714CE9A
MTAESVHQPDDGLEWAPFVRQDEPYRIRATSCCGHFELASQGGQYLILRPAEGGGYDETARGTYSRTYVVWDTLVAAAHGSQPSTGIRKAG